LFGDTVDALSIDLVGDKIELQFFLDHAGEEAAALSAAASPSPS
jgi:hypothetical protein